MTTQTNDRGRRFEELYDACLKLPADQQEDFITRETAGDTELAKQLRVMIKLEHPASGSLFQAGAQSHDAGPDDLTSGTVFGKCRIVNLIDTGAMGAVYFALDLQNHERPVALKVMRPTLLAERDRERFMRESAALSRLVHQNIARLYFRDVEKWNGTDRPFLVMEFVAGATLDKFLDHGHLSTRQVLELLAKIARAVHHGHRNGVFHRDLKPSNILVSPDGEPKIIDYGVSFTVTSESANGTGSASNENAGTIPYMAPEVASGAAYVPDARTDVYSLGIIAFEAFARRRPGVVLPAGEVEALDPPITSRQMRKKIAVCERERLRAAHRGVAFDLDCVIARAMRLKIEDRYADAGEFAEDLRRLIDFEPIKELRKSHVYNAKLFVRRNRLAVIAALAIFATVSVAAIEFRNQRNEVTVQKNMAIDAGKKEAEARRIAEDERDQIRKQDAADHMRSAQFAEQRGNWSAAAEEYLAAEKGGALDHLGLAVGQLRALDRLDRQTDAKRLIDRVHKTMPEIASSPQFQVREGFFFWVSDQAKSVETIQASLNHGDQLPPADRAFAQALITDDIHVVAGKLRETVANDPFNRDAWTLLSIVDLGLGNARQSEQDAAVLRTLYPDDAFAAVIAALAAAFQQRKADAAAYLNGDPSLPLDVRTMVLDVVALVSKYPTADDFHGYNPLDVERISFDILRCAQMLSNSRGPLIPLMLSGHIDTNPWLFAANLTNLKLLLEKVSALPGVGDYLAAENDIFERNPAAAVPHLEKALVSPSLIDCRRSAAALLTLAHWLDGNNRHLPGSQRTVVAEQDLDRLISLGGIPASPKSEYEQALRVGFAADAYRQVRILAMSWLTHAPDDSRPNFFAGWAYLHLGDPDTARGFFNRSLANGLDGGLKQVAVAMLRDLSSAPATRPATMP